MIGHEPLTPLLELDPELGRLLASDRAREATAELRVRLSLVPRGLWDADRLSSAHPEHVGLLMLDGMLAREVLIADTVSTELLGPGDVVRPWRDGDRRGCCTHEVRWTVLADVRLAVLDRRFAGRLVRFPEVNAMIDRAAERSRAAARGLAGDLAAQPGRPPPARAVLAARRALGPDDLATAWPSR